MSGELINGWCRHHKPFTSCTECSSRVEADSVTEALQDALERQPETTWRCPHCKRVLNDAGWQCLPWLQFAGAIRSGRLWVAVEVRRCNCSKPIGREVALPLLEVS
jgi:hypothetical protein